MVTRHSLINFRISFKKVLKLLQWNKLSIKFDKTRKISKTFMVWHTHVNVKSETQIQLSTFFFCPYSGRICPTGLEWVKTIALPARANQTLAVGLFQMQWSWMLVPVPQQRCLWHQLPHSQEHWPLATVQIYQHKRMHKKLPLPQGCKRNSLHHECASQASVCRSSLGNILQKVIACSLACLKASSGTQGQLVG